MFDRLRRTDSRSSRSPHRRTSYSHGYGTTFAHVERARVEDCMGTRARFERPAVRLRRSTRIRRTSKITAASLPADVAIRAPAAPGHPSFPCRLSRLVRRCRPTHAQDRRLQSYFPRAVRRADVAGCARAEDAGKRVRGVPMLVDLDIRFRVMDAFEDYQQILSIATPPIEAYASPARRRGSRPARQRWHGRARRSVTRIAFPGSWHRCR